MRAVVYDKDLKKSLAKWNWIMSDWIFVNSANKRFLYFHPKKKISVHISIDYSCVYFCILFFLYLGVLLLLRTYGRCSKKGTPSPDPKIFRLIMYEFLSLMSKKIKCCKMKKQNKIINIHLIIWIVNKIINTKYLYISIVDV